MKIIINRDYSKCWLCIQDANAAEKEVIAFPQFGVCLCDFHMRKMIGEYLNIEPILQLDNEE